MLKTVKGIYRKGRIELLETLPESFEGQVIVTFLGSDRVNLADRDIDEKKAEDLRRRLGAFAEDWDRDEMDVYDAL